MVAAAQIYCLFTVELIFKMILENNSKKSDIFNSSPANFKLEVKFNRKDISYENNSERFICVLKDFTKQFAHIYAGRLNSMRPRVMECSFKKWGSHIPIRKLSELTDESNDKCIVIGTLFKHQELKPSILKEMFEENQVLPQPLRKSYMSDDDQLILEDETQRIRLVGNFDTKKFITGVVTALLGFENQEGKFEVEDMCFADLIINPQRPLKLNENSYIVMISGLSLGNIKNALALDLLVDWIKGEIGSLSDQEKWSQVCRVIICGNSIMGSHSVGSSNIINTEIEDKADTLTYVKQLDDILHELVQSVEVDIMPGEFDPSNHNLPQQAIHNCVFPKASQYQSFHSVTNPYECNIGGRTILGSSGQPINDISMLSDIGKPLDILESTLKWSHLAPTAPDTLACYPYYNEDPFIINKQPDIYFAGNQPELATKLINLNGNSTRLICIPSFAENQTCCVVNLKTLECSPLTFTV